MQSTALVLTTKEQPHNTQKIANPMTNKLAGVKKNTKETNVKPTGPSSPVRTAHMANSAIHPSGVGE